MIFCSDQSRLFLDKAPEPTLRDLDGPIVLVGPIIAMQEDIQIAVKMTTDRKSALGKQPFYEGRRRSGTLAGQWPVIILVRGPIPLTIHQRSGSYICHVLCSIDAQVFLNPEVCAKA